MTRKLVVFLVITFIVGLSGCLGPDSTNLEPSGPDKSQGIIEVNRAYTWRIDYYGREDGRDLGILRFENTGNNLSGVKFRFEFYRSNGSRYSVESVNIGDVASDEIVQMKVSLPGRYLGAETWSQEKIFVYANGVREEQQTGELSNTYKNKGIIDNANRLLGDYKWKLELVTEIQKRTDALGTAATKEMYIEWEFRNKEAIDSGERLATYITEHRDVLGQYWTSDVLVLIATNKVTFERDNQALERIINSRELQAKRYRWRIDYYGREGSRDMGILRFENMGKNLSGVKFRFEFYKSNGALYSTESLDIGDVASGEIVRTKVSLPGRYLSEETWSEKKIFVYVNGVWEEQQY